MENSSNIKITKYTSSSSPLPPIQLHSLINYNNSLISFGGFQSSSISPTIHLIEFEEFDEKFKSKQINEITSNRWQSIISKINDSTFLLYGGISEFGVLNDFYKIIINDEINYKFEKIEIKETKMSLRFGAAIQIVDENFAYILGGISSKFKLNDEEEEMFILNISNAELEAVDNQTHMPMMRHFHCFDKISNFLFVFGGQDEDGNTFNDIFSFDINSRLWTQIEVSGVSPSLRFPKSIVLNDCIYYIFGDNESESSAIQVYDSSTSKWLSPLTSNELQYRRWHAVEKIGKDIFIFGGEDEEGNATNDLYKIEILCA